MIRTTFRAVLLTGAATLALSACKDKAAIDGGSSAAVDAISVKGLSDKDIASHFDVAPRKVDTASADAALATLGLGTKSDTLSWASREGSDGTYTYSNVQLSEDGESVGTIETLQLFGIREEGDTTSLDKLIANGIDMKQDGNSLKVASLTLVEPRMDEVDRLMDGGDEFELPTARAMAAEDISLDFSENGETGSLNIDTVAFADGRADKRDGFLRLNDLKMTMQDGETPMNFSLSDVTVTGMTQMDQLTGGGSLNPMSGMTSMSKMSNPYALPFRSANIGTFSLDADTLSVNSDGLQMVYEDKGKRIEGKSNMAPLSITFTGEPTEPELADLYKMFSSLGYETLEFSGAGTSMIDTEKDIATSEGGYIALKDGFRLEFDTEVTGMKAMMEAQKAALAEAGFTEAPGPNATDEERFQYSMAQSSATMSGVEDLKFGKLVMRFDDNSIVDRIFKVVAEQQGTSPKLLRMQAKGMLAMGTMMGQGSGIDAEIITDTVAALGEFLDNPGSTLTLGMDPQAPISMMEAPSLDKAAMGFVAKVDQ